MASGQTVKDQERSATWNNTGATSSAGSSPSENTKSTPGERWTPPKHEPHHRANVRWTETRSQIQNVRPLSIVLLCSGSRLRD